MIKRIFFDVFFYLAVPLIIWNLFRNDLGDYYTILFGMVPSVMYTITVFIIKKEWNVTGIFFLSLISMNMLFNILSDTAEQELWNSVYMGIISVIFYLLTIFVKKPIGMYFFIDYAHAKGVPREDSLKLYRENKNYPHFIKFTLFLILREVIVSIVKSILIVEKGVDGFNAIQITNAVLNYTFTGLTVVYVIHILRRIKDDKKKIR